jgi:hypothetical protein
VDNVTNPYFSPVTGVVNTPIYTGDPSYTPD